MGFGVLFLLLLVTAGWWLHSRWSALRDAQAARREAEMMFIMEARLHAAGKVGREAGRSVRAERLLPDLARQMRRARRRRHRRAHDSGRVLRSGVRHIGTLKEVLDATRFHRGRRCTIIRHRHRPPTRS